MIKLLDMQAKDVHLLMDIPLRDLEMLVHVLENCTYNYNSENKEEQEIAQELTTKLFPNLKMVLEAAHGTPNT